MSGAPHLHPRPTSPARSSSGVAVVITAQKPLRIMNIDVAIKHHAFLERAGATRTVRQQEMISER